MGTNYIAPIWRMPRNANKDKLSNYSIGFDNTNANYIQTSASWITDLGLNGASRLSVSIWLKPSSSAPTTAMSATSSPYHNWSENFNIKYDAGNTAMIFTGGSSASNKFYNNSVTLTTDQWHHVVFVFTPSGTAAERTRCWINNSEVANQATNLWVSFPDQGYPLYIGRLFYGASGSTNQWVGEISQFCIFDYSLTDGTGGTTNQIEYLYNLNNPMAITGAEPVAYWPLGDNSNPNSDAGYPNISVGADSVFDFNGATGVIPLPQGSIQVETAITISAWIKTTTTGTRQEILGNDNVSSSSNDAGRCWALRVNGQNIVFVVKQENGATATGPYFAITTSGVNVGDNNWHHVVALWDGTTTTNAVKVFVDGILRGQTTSSFTQPIRHWAPNIPTIGDAAGQTQFWDFEGEMSNIQIWEAGLTYGTVSSLGDTAEGEVSQLYNNGQPLMTGTQPQAANLKGWWKLNQSANWEADTASEWQIPDAMSSYPQSFDFGDANAGGEYIDAPTNIGGFTKCSTSVWLNPSSVSAPSTIFATNTASNFTAYFWNGNIIYVTVGGVYGYLAAISNYIDANKWNHLSIIYDGTFTDPDAATQNAGRLKMYVNGSYIAFQAISGTIPSSIPVSGSDNIRIGTTSPTTYEFGGELSNFTIYDTNLSASQVETLYNNGVPLTTAIATDNLKAWYKLDNTEYFNNEGKWIVDNDAITPFYNNALNFTNQSNGSGNSIKVFSGTPASLPSNLSFGASDSFSFSTWLWSETKKSNSNMAFVMRGSSGSDPYNRLDCYYLSANNSLRLSMNLRSDNAATASVATTAAVPGHPESGAWFNVVVVINRTAQTLQMFLNGKGTTTASISSLDGFLNLSSIAIGNDPYNGGRFYYEGRQSNFAIFNTALTQSQIETLYNNGTPEENISFSPVSWWKLNNLSTGIQDSAGGGNDATAASWMTVVESSINANIGVSSGMTEQNLVNNNVSVLNGESSGMNTTNLVQSNLTRKQPYSNYSFNFDNAQSDGFNIPSSNTLKPTRTLSLSAWIYRATNSIQHPIFDQGQRSGVLLWLNQSSNPSTLGFYIQNGSPGDPWTQYVSTGTVLKEQWNHVCVTLDKNSGNLKFYINGQDAGGTGTVPVGDIGWSATNLFTIGSHRGIYYFDGQISNVCMFDRVLTEQEVLKIFNNGITQDLQAASSFSNNILAWWPMDEHSSYYDGTDWVVRDLENGNDGDGANTGNVDDLVGNAPGSEASGSGTNLTIGDLKGNMYNSKHNAYSINMADYADGITNPANSGRSTEIPTV